MPLFPPIVLIACLLGIMGGTLTYSAGFLLMGAAAFMLWYLIDLYFVDMTQDRNCIVAGFAIIVIAFGSFAAGVMLPALVILGILALVLNFVGIKNGMRHDHPHRQT